VGFRPFIFNLASRFRISGSVTNTSGGVLIRAIAQDETIFAFIEAISSEAPPLADIVDIVTTPLQEKLDATSFSIVASQATESTQAIIPPDIAVCHDCCEELLNPKDVRYRYPFTNCTNCGPRFTITKSIPYDRPKTSMHLFPMCTRCIREYEDPTNRRFHAQPNACPDCGPAISWHDRSGQEIDTDDIIATAIFHLASDKIVAIRGLGGFHLCTDACSETAVQTLRTRKNRPDKPLAVMVRDIKAVEKFCHLSDRERKLLQSPQHPIVLLIKRAGGPLASNLAPGISDLGVMLPYTPLHYLMFAESGCPPALVMTSGNSSGEPICTANDDALKRLQSIADYFLLHNRDIVTRVDDSVVKVIADEVRTFRRARGYVPSPLLVPYELPQIIGCGGGLKSTFSLGRGDMIFPSQHIGDLFNHSSYEFYTESITNLKKVFNIAPEAVACDLHPDYMSSHYAKELDLPLYKIQHHHAHAVAVMAEHGLSEPVLAIILDGTGFGTDKTIWGGEILQADLTGFRRLGALETFPLPGGDKASTEPWRMALSLLYRLEPRTAAESPLLKVIDTASRKTIAQMLENNFNAPLTSSCGRLFDGIAALLGLNFVSTYEGQAAMQLEACARKAVKSNWKDSLIMSMADNFAHLHKKNPQRWEIISSEFVKKVVYDVSSGKNRPDIALQFHSWLISTISRLVEKLSETTGITKIALSGGCMQNELLLEGLIFTLTEMGLHPYTGSKIPINDGGISIGQTIIGGLRHVSRGTNEN